MSTLTAVRPARVEAVRPRAPRTAAVPAPTRLTRRGRAAVVLLLVLALFLVVSLAARGASSEAGTSPGQTATVYVTVQPGETLWQIAQRVAPQMDVRDAVDRIRQLNALSTTTLQAGQRLVVPAHG